MKRLFYFCTVVLVSLLASCGPKIHRLDDTPFIYIETKEGRLYGFEENGRRSFEPIWNSLNGERLAGDVWLATKNGKTILFEYSGTPLCDSIPLASTNIEHMYRRGGSGVPGYYYRVLTKEGVFSLYYDKNYAKWYQYGPFKDYVAGTTGYMFKDNKTGKWGVAKYGTWEDLGDKDSYGRKRVTMDSRWKFVYARHDVLIAPQYDQVINIAYESKSASADGGRRGYTHEKDIKWYAYDGKKWQAFNIHGQPIAVNASELNSALKLKPHQDEIRRNNMHNLVTQRCGHNEASMVIINPYPYR